MTNKAIFLVSLNSKKLESFLADNTEIKIDNEIETLDVFVFDIFETLNGLFFNSRDIEQQTGVTENTISKVQKQIVERDSANRTLVRFTDLQKEINPYFAAVYKEYFTNASFKRHCKSQMFQNLQPKLRNVGIADHRSHLLDLIVPFLLAEIAFYLFVFDTQEYDVIYGLESEMNIISDIKQNKYPTFRGFIKKEIPHLKMLTD